MDALLIVLFLCLKRRSDREPYGERERFVPDTKQTLKADNYWGRFHLETSDVNLSLSVLITLFKHRKNSSDEIKTSRSCRTSPSPHLQMTTVVLRVALDKQAAHVRHRLCDNRAPGLSKVTPLLLCVLNNLSRIHALLSSLFKCISGSNSISLQM